MGSAGSRIGQGMYQTAAPGMANYQNPYETGVVQTAMGDLNDAAQQGRMQTSVAAQQAGAFGGSRHGVAQAQSDIGFQKQMADTAARMRMQGYNTALGASQADLGRQMGAAGQMAGLGQQYFGVGQGVQNQQMQQGALQQAMQQQLMDAARGQFQNFTGAPAQSLGYLTQAMGVSPQPTTTTQTQSPGLFDYLSLGAGLFASDSRLKKNVELVEVVDGVNVYRWEWNAIGRNIKTDGQPATGVMADELLETRPHLVTRGSDGYLRVDYAALRDEMEERNFSF